MLFPILLVFGAVTGIAILSKRSPAHPTPQPVRYLPPPAMMTAQPPPASAAHPLIAARLAAMRGVATRMAPIAAPAPAPSSPTAAGLTGIMMDPIIAGEVSAIELLLQACEHGMEIPTALVVAALAEAAENGDVETFRDIVAAFPPPSIASGEQSEEAPQQETTIGFSIASPIRGVGDAQWQAFVARLRTQEPSFKDGRHVGAYYHNVKRLAELGINPESLADESAQYQALESDFKAIEVAQRKLINDWCGDVLRINGESTPITHSGILGLLKAAGVEGAKQWLTSEESRLKYPNTTKQFLATNGLF